MNILHIIPHQTYSGIISEIVPLAADQTAHGHRVRIACLAKAGPAKTRLEATGAQVATLGWTRAFDVTPAWQLRDLLLEKNDLVHVWGISALRWVGLLTPSLLPNVVFCPPLPQRRQPMDRWLLGRVRMFVRDEAEYQQAVAGGGRRVKILPPGIELMPHGERRPKRILAVGPIERHKNFQKAVWTMDILNEVFSDATLALVGDGGERSAVERFASLLTKSRVDLVGQPEVLTSEFAAADLCWLMASRGSRHAALEAMAAGRAIVASDLPHLREMIPAEAGCFAPVGDNVARARATRALFVDPDRCRAMGEAGQRHAAACYSQQTFLERWREACAA